jgi:hypothetical protein
MDFPKMVYHKSGLHTTVKSEEELNKLLPFWEVGVWIPNTKSIHFNAALDMIKEVEKEVKEDVKESTKLKDYKKMGWHELRAYGKELEKKHGVELPLRAKRDTVEKAIQEVLNGNYKRPS